MDNFLMKQLRPIVVHVHISAAREILKIDGKVYCDLVLHDLPRLENGDLLQLLCCDLDRNNLRIIILLFQLEDLQTPTILGATYQVLVSFTQEDLHHKTLGEKCRKEVPRRKSFSEILPWEKPASVEW
eukprot:scaffold1354_cov366-Pavlova_lutheri.AAC.4